MKLGLLADIHEHNDDLRAALDMKEIAMKTFDEEQAATAEVVVRGTVAADAAGPERGGWLTRIVSVPKDEYSAVVLFEDGKKVKTLECASKTLKTSP
ncbi:MAG: hypothetical protein HQ581_16895 [Planctomycetes bacterium]|nr:hypothetical protein [Planctomycetota bacterium]